ncbi:cell division protein SepF [Gordonia effusa NBRC 100432]|uniref:Cell division protein SepF n=1 Tax=Gordonia effusa NBRC 100432 TaxID=1077974 RepID=H0R2M7_9ACTN|nr:cell division protein SepF [Gordonia effusa]GAB19328.1 cell division protein SepF [Gordonia effusa NBRC 100432]
MTTMQKFKAYFGMVPPSDYEDDYLEDSNVMPARSASRERAYRDDYYGQGAYRDGRYADRFEADRFEDRYADERFAEDRYADERFETERRVAGGEYAYAGPMRADRERSGVSRLEPLPRSAAGMRAAGVSRSVAVNDQRELDRIFADGPLQKITTLRPSDYGEARTIGERFRDGNPVIMDLVDMSNDDAKRLVDFAAGLAFALRGSFDKVATKVFLLSPADVDVSPEDRRKIAETGFYNHN